MSNRTWNILFYSALTIIGAALCAAAHAYMTAKRGYTAYGGEYFLLLLPLAVWGLEAGLIKDHETPGRCDCCRHWQRSLFAPWGDCKYNALPMAGYGGCRRYRKTKEASRG